MVKIPKNASPRAIQRIIGEANDNERIVFPVGEFEVPPIRLSRPVVISGQGPGTVLKHTTHGHGRVAMFSGSADLVRFHQLKFDLGLREAGPNSHSCPMAIWIDGCNNTVEGVHVTNFGSQVAGLECFPIGFYKMSGLMRGNVIIECKAYDPALDNTKDGTTVFTLSVASNSASEDLSNAINWCDVDCTDSVRSHYCHAFSAPSIRYCSSRNCRNMAYIDTWTHPTVVWRDNHSYGTDHPAMDLNFGQGRGSAGAVVIKDNVIHVENPDLTYPRGIRLQSGGSDVQFGHAEVRGNVIIHTDDGISGADIHLSGVLGGMVQGNLANKITNYNTGPTRFLINFNQKSQQSNPVLEIPKV